MRLVCVEWLDIYASAGWEKEDEIEPQTFWTVGYLIVKDSINAWTYYSFFGLIAVTGMRTGEAIALSRHSVDLNQGIITILESKNKKSRKIPIHSSVKTILKQYSEVREHFLKKSSCFFL